MLQGQKADLTRAARFAGWIATAMGRMSTRSRVEGFVDQVVADAVQGWAFDPARPDRRVLVIASAGGEVISETLADLPRKDLADAGKGDGRHGFRLRIPKNLSPEKRSNIRIEAVAKPRNVVLQRGEIIVPPPALKPEAGEQSAPSQPSVGFLEQFRSGVLKGWAVDPNHPTAPARVDIFDGETYLGTVTCDRERAKLRAGAREFVFTIPDGFEPGPGDALRGRIAGTRRELKRSRQYPDAESPLGIEPEHAPESLPPLELAAPTTAGPPSNTHVSKRGLRVLAAPTTPRVDVLFLVCGQVRPEHEALESCVRQSWSNIQVSRADIGEAQLNALLGASNIVVLLQSDQRVELDLAAALIQAPGPADVWRWRNDPRRTGTADPEVAALLTGASGGAFAMRSSVLARFESDLAATLAAGDLDQIIRWAVACGLRWIQLPALLSNGPESPLPALPPPPQPPRRISLAVWSGWDAGVPPALERLVSSCQACEVEVLVPAAVDDTVEAGLRAKASDALLTLSIRRVDAALSGGIANLRALGEAATGQVVVLCHGEVLIPEQGSALAEACAWAHHRRIGAVTVEIASEDEQPVLAGVTVARLGASLRLASTFDSDQQGRPRPMLAAPALFMVVSRAGLAAVGGFDDRCLGPEAAALDLSLKLRSVGRVAAVLGQHRAQGPRSAILNLLEPAFSPLEMALIGDAAERGAIAYQAPDGFLDPRAR